MKILRGLPKTDVVGVNSLADLPEGEQFQVTFQSSGPDQKSQRHTLVLYQGVWFGYSEAF